MESAGQEAGQRSLIFLNACSVAEQSGIDHGSVVAVFAANRHPAIIGTETSLDVITAHRTTRLFYEHLLAGHGAAKALFLARRTLLDESDPFNLTPGALIYSCYGLPSACLKAAVPIRLDPDAVSATDMRFFFPSGS